MDFGQLRISHVIDIEIKKTNERVSAEAKVECTVVSAEVITLYNILELALESVISFNP